MKDSILEFIVENMLKLFLGSVLVAVAQPVESRIVIPAVVGSSPISHPTYVVDFILAPKKRAFLKLFPMNNHP